jgi:hypothetical protein
MSYVEITYISEINGCIPKISVGTRFERFSYVQEVQPNSGKISCNLEFKPIDSLLIQFSDKVWNDLPTWMQITHIEIDQIQLDQIILSGKQYPDYSKIDFDLRSSPPYYCPGTRFNLNGVYELDIYFPIWHFRTNRSNVS